MAGENAGSRAGGSNPWLIAVVVSIATFMEVLDTTIANVALRYIAGGLAVGPDEASWVVTTYLVANAIVLCGSAWVVKKVGRKRFYMACVAVFTLSSILCGFAWNLESLLFFRVLQGLGGGGMAPSEQSILADSFPPGKRAQAFAIYGVAVVVAPVVGPTLGGWLSDNVSWHWCFLINGPIGLTSLALVHLLVPGDEAGAPKTRAARSGRARFDFVGFALIATGLGALEVVLDRGQRDDWFDSAFIVTFAAISAAALLAYVPWALARRDPVVDLRMLFTRQFGTCWLIMLSVGAVIISTSQFIPQLLQDYYGYTATIAGLALTPGGLVSMVMMFLAGRALSHVQPKYVIAAGGTVVALALYHLTNIYADLTFGWFMWSRMAIELGLPMMFLAITNASYDGLPPDKTDQASALINVARNLGGSMGVSLADNVLMHRQQFHQSRLSEHVVPSAPGYQEAMRRASDYFAMRGSSALDAQGQATAWIGQQVETQAAYWAYIDVFAALGLVAALAVPLALTLRSVKLGGEAVAA